MLASANETLVGIRPGGSRERVVGGVANGLRDRSGHEH